MSIRFLTVDDVLEIHQDEIDHYGGEPTLRDRGLLESAVAAPQAAFGAEYLHAFPHEMAAAYLFHISANHAFVDGNKRTGLAAAIVFLKLNQIEYHIDEREAEEITRAVACGGADKARVTEFFGQRAPG